MRISELLQLPLDCLTQDARGTFYLRFMQGKMKREHTIPVSQEIARVVQDGGNADQQEAIIAHVVWGEPLGLPQFAGIALIAGGILLLHQT